MCRKGSHRGTIRQRGSASQRGNLSRELSLSLFRRSGSSGVHRPPSDGDRYRGRKQADPVAASSSDVSPFFRDPRLTYLEVRCANERGSSSLAGTNDLSARPRNLIYRRKESAGNKRERNISNPSDHKRWLLLRPEMGHGPARNPPARCSVASRMNGLRSIATGSFGNPGRVLRKKESAQGYLCRS